MSIKVEEKEFVFSEDQLVVEIDSRNREYQDSSEQSHPYISTCMDEFSRNFRTFSVAKNLPATVPICPYQIDSSNLRFPDLVEAEALSEESLLSQTPSRDGSSTSRVLQHYHPGYFGWPSTFKQSPPDTKNLLGDRPSTDRNLLVKVDRLISKIAFEPMFGSLCLYAFSGEDFCRVSESFFFDLTTPEICKKFHEVYLTTVEDLQDFNSVECNKQDPATILKTCMFSIPAELRTTNLFLIWQLHKVLTADTDKAIQPYVTPAYQTSRNLPEFVKHEDACRRLIKYKQSLGFGVAKVFDDNLKVIGSPSISIQAYATRASMGDAMLGSIVKEMFPLEGKGTTRENLDIELSLTVYDLGRDDEFAGFLPPGEPRGATPAPRFLVPAQFHSPFDAALAWCDVTPTNHDESRKMDPARKEEELVKRAVRCVQPLPPPSMFATDDVTRRMRTSLDHTLYVYPLSFEKFSNRNLCIRVQLVEFQERITEGVPTTEPFKVLRNVYNILPGPAFRSSAFTTVWYHDFKPNLNDEIKIRLPMVLTDRHWLKFYVYHIHVKLKPDKTPSLMHIRRKGGVSEDSSRLPLGKGYLQLLPESLSLLPDRDHLVEISGENLNDGSTVDEDEKSSPSVSASSWASKGRRVSSDLAPCSIRVRTRALSSLVSTSKAVQTLLIHQPTPLGRLPSSVIPPPRPQPGTPLPPSTSHGIRLGPPFDLLKLQREEKLLQDAAMGLQDAAPSEVTRHFLVIIRILIRIMCGGTCKYKGEYSNPYRHPMARCSAFLSMLLVFGKVAPETHLLRSVNSKATGEELLHSYVEYLFDEEVPDYPVSAVESRPPAPPPAIVSGTIIEENIVEATEHVLNELVRVIQHIEFSEAVDQVSSEIQIRPDEEFPVPGSHLFALTQRHLRWWSMAGNLPFNSERAWFESADGNPLYSVAMSESSPGTPVESYSGKEQSAVDFEDSNVGGSPSEKTALTMFDENVITLHSLQKRYDRLEGFAERQARHPGGQISMDIQWWPSVYEVIVHQWHSALCQIQDNGLSESEIEETSSYDEQEDRENEQSGATSTKSSCYPFAKEALLTSSEANQDIRSLALDHGPILLKMILKSLAMKLKREKLTCPVILDNQFMFSLEKLVITLSTEIVSMVKGPWRSKKLNIALAQFLRGLFGFIAPLHVAKLIYYYFANLRKKDKIAEIELRLQFLEELSQFDLIVPANFPLTLDVTGAYFRPLSLRNSIDLQFVHNGASMRGIRNPPSQWLAHLIIEEFIIAYRHEEKSVKERAVATLRDLFVRHSYDLRYQYPEARQRIAAMYLPLIGEIVTESDKLCDEDCDVMERKDVLALLLYILQDAPERLLREEWRLMTKYQPKRNLGSGSNRTSVSFMENGVRRRFSGMMSTGMMDPMIIKMLKMLHIALDSFEFPLMPGGEQGDPTKILVPWLINGADFLRDNTSQSAKPVPRGGTAQTNKVNPEMSTRIMDMLRQRHMDPRDSIVKTGPPRPGEQRKWKDRQDRIQNFKSATATNKRTYMNAVSSISPATMLNAAQSMSHESSCIVLYTLTIILEECPPLLVGKSGSVSFQGIYAEFMTQAVSIILHGLLSFLSEIAVVNFFAAGQLYLRRFGFRIFLAATGDTLQDWLRSAIGYCCSQCLRPRIAACDFLLYLFQTCFHYMGTLEPVHSTCTAVFSGVVKSILNKNRDRAPRGGLVKFLLPLHLSIDQMEKAVETRGADGFPKHHQFTMAFKKVMRDLATLLVAEYDLHDHFPESANESEWDGNNTLDGILSSEGFKPTFFGERIAAKTGSPHISGGGTNSDTESIMDHFAKAADVFDSFQFPRFKIYWLEHLARLHDKYGNKAESAEIRWRIFRTCDDVRLTWMKLWSPRPGLTWNKGLSNDAKEFLGTLNDTLTKSSAKPWPDDSCLLQHMLTSLSISAETFADVGLVHLAERAWYCYMGLCRANGLLVCMTPEYTRIGKVFESLTDAKTRFAMGSFYRVQFGGLGVPPHFRGKEFIYRNANHLRVAEFQKLMIDHLESIVPKNQGIKVSVVSDTTTGQSEDSKDAFIVMTSMKPVLTALHHKSFQVLNLSGLDDMASLNQVRCFQYSVPFTLAGKAHAKDINQQWKRTTVLTVSEPFPNIVTRQLVIRRDIKELSPIEVAIEDVRERVDDMRAELSRQHKDQSETNNLQRIVQGTVAPQVNAGAAEVAKVFLFRVEDTSITLSSTSSPDIIAGSSDSNKVIEGIDDDVKAAAFRAELKTTLVEFLSCCRKLLNKCRRVLLGDDEVQIKNSAALVRANTMLPDAVKIVGGGSGLTPPQEPPNHNVIWQEEMEKGYTILVDAIYPYISDVPGSNSLRKYLRRSSSSSKY